MTLIAVLDYGIGNLRSAQKALQRLGADARLTADEGLIREAAGLVLPGVGAFGRCMTELNRSGIADLASAAIEAGRPFLGICVGMQMLYEGSDESPGVPGMGVLEGGVHLLAGDVKRPQMQWNRLDVCRATPLTAGLDDPGWVYFVHSFAAEMTPDVVATCDYGGPVAAAIVRDNLWATQFHPEKSAGAGLQVLSNFMEMAAAAPVASRPCVGRADGR